MLNETQLREHMCQIGRWMWQKNFSAGNDGNISVRVGNRILITPSGLNKGLMRPEQMIWVDLEGALLPVSAGLGLTPSSETPMHTMAYRQRSDVGAVVHAHTPAAIALSLAGYSIAGDVIPEIVYSLGCIPTLPYSPPASQDNAAIIAIPIRTHDALVLTHHGALAVGPDLQTAYDYIERVEHAAQITAQALQLGALHSIPAGEYERVRAWRQSKRPGATLCPGGPACPHNTLYAATAARVAGGG